MDRDDFQIAAVDENEHVVDAGEGGRFHVAGMAAVMAERACRRGEVVAIHIRPKPLPEPPSTGSAQSQEQG